MTQLRKLGTVLKAELRNQANEHKEEIDSFIGPSHGHQSLPTKAQHNKGMRLNKQEISDDIQAQLRLEIEIRHNTQDHKMSDHHKQLDGKWVSFKMKVKGTTWNSKIWD